MEERATLLQEELDDVKDTHSVSSCLQQAIKSSQAYMLAVLCEQLSADDKWISIA